MPIDIWTGETGFFTNIQELSCGEDPLDVRETARIPGCVRQTKEESLRSAKFLAEEKQRIADQEQ